MSAASILESVKDYYGKTLTSKQDLKTTACCTADAIPEYQRQVLAKIDDEILTKFYGCGSPIPPLLQGKTVLDLGCGTGRDVYLAAYFAGRKGFVIGIDMTEEQLEVAQRHVLTQSRKFGFDEPNVSFRQGYIENLQDAGIDDNSVDVVISNCVINLSPVKETAFAEIFRVLKPGGELYFSDVFADRRIPETLRDDPVLYGECLSGAMYIEDFRRLLQRVGVSDHRVVSKCPLEVTQKEIAEKIGGITFYSMTVRAFKLDSLEDICEDYGQAAVYRGSIPHFPHAFELDDHHKFITGKIKTVCGNTAAMLQESRYAEHFRFIGDRSTHFGAFDCAPETASGETAASCGC